MIPDKEGPVKSGATPSTQPQINTAGVGKLDLKSDGDAGPVKLGFGLSGNTGTDFKTVEAYINGLAKADPTTFANIIKALQNVGLAKDIKNYAQVGTVVARVYENMLNDPNPALRQVTLEQFLNSVSKNFQFGKPVRPPSKQYYLTTPDNAAAEINDQFTKVLGVTATPQEQKAYYKELLKAQKKAPMVTSSADGQVVQTAGFSSAEKEALLNKFVAQRAQQVFGKSVALGGTTVEVTKPEQFTGEYLKSIDAIKAYSSAYGVPMSEYEIKKAAITALTTPGGIDAQTEQIKNVAKGIYSGLSQFIDQGITTQKLLSPYISMKAKLLEIPEEQITLNSTEGQQVISKVVSDKGLLPIYNYERELRQDPRWRFTKNANEEAANWVSSIMKSFGIAS